MSAKGSYGSEWEVKKKTGMGQQLGGLDEFKDLQESACVHVQERELIAYCRAFKILFPKATNFNQFLEKKAKPALIAIGRGRWYRDVLTDLSLGLSVRGKTDQKEDVSKLVDKE